MVMCNPISISNLSYLNIISVDEKTIVIGYVFKHVFKELTSKNVARSFSTAKDRPHIVNSTNFPETDRLHGVSTL